MKKEVALDKKAIKFMVMNTLVGFRGFLVNRGFEFKSWWERFQSSLLIYIRYLC